MSDDWIQETRRQVEICNACRYCEGYCAVFPAINREQSFADGDIMQLANLCHNCRGCYYACQYIAPHEFAINLPQALAEVRQESWKIHSWPTPFATAFERSGVLIAGLLITSLFASFVLAAWLRPESGEGFYAYIAHGMMVTIFAPAFLVPLLAIGISMQRYWRTIGGGKVSLADVTGAVKSAGRLTNLSGGQGQGCNFEDEDRFSNARRIFHQATMYGFLLCFASTSSATILHYVFDLHAPYAFFSLPKLLGLPGGLLLCVGTAGLAWLKLKADPALAVARIWSGEMAFVLLLFFVSATGLVLYAASGSSIVALLLPLHLSMVLTLFLLIPYSKMAHGFYRFAALLHDAAKR